MIEPKPLRECVGNTIIEADWVDVQQIRGAVEELKKELCPQATNCIECSTCAKIDWWVGV